MKHTCINEKGKSLTPLGRNLQPEKSGASGSPDGRSSRAIGSTARAALNLVQRQPVQSHIFQLDFLLLKCLISCEAL
jgi:hypothetical protein